MREIRTSSSMRGCRKRATAQRACALLYGEAPCSCAQTRLRVDTKHRNAYIWGMVMVPLTPERKAQLDDYARRLGQAPADALDEVLADALAWERQEYDETVVAVTEAYESVKAGKTRPAEEFLEELRAKHGFPR